MRVAERRHADVEAQLGPQVLRLQLQLETERLDLVLLFVRLVQALADEQVQALVLLHQWVVAHADDALMFLALRRQVQHLERAPKKPSKKRFETIPTELLDSSAI